MLKGEYLLKILISNKVNNKQKGLTKNHFTVL